MKVDVLGFGANFTLVDVLSVGDQNRTCLPPAVQLRRSINTCMHSSVLAQHSKLSTPLAARWLLAARSPSSSAILGGPLMAPSPVIALAARRVLAARRAMAARRTLLKAEILN